MGQGNQRPREENDFFSPNSSMGWCYVAYSLLVGESLFRRLSPESGLRAVGMSLTLEGFSFEVGFQDIGSNVRVALPYAEDRYAWVYRAWKTSGVVSLAGD